MASSDYYICPICDEKALYDSDEYGVGPAEVEVLHKTCLDKDRAAVRAEGFAEAVAMLRDDDRYRNWWSYADELDPTYGYWLASARNHLADYLETIKLPLPSVSRPPAAEGSGTPEVDREGA